MPSGILVSTHVLKPRILIPYIQRANVSGKAVKVKVINRPQASAPSLEDATRMAEKLRVLSENNRTQFDVWALPSPLLDLRVPVSIFANGYSPRKIWTSVEHNLSNYVANAVAMHRMAKANSFPWNPDYRGYSPQILMAGSTLSKSWLTPLRNTALNVYKELNLAVASGHKEPIQKLTSGHYRERLLERLKVVSHTRKTRLKWELHSLASPVRCVSFRAQPGHMGSKPLSFGTRYFAQACMKFDTWQSLRPETEGGEPKRVIEYLVFEKKMWYDEPWKIRDQLWPTLTGNK